MPSGLRYIPPYTRTFHPIKDPATAEWGLAINRVDYEKLLEGFSPRDMDDKWMCRTDKPDAHGNTIVHWYRSMTDMEFYTITVDLNDPSDAEGDHWARLTKINWEKVVGSLEVPPEEAKESLVNLCRGYMGCRFENAVSAASAE
ncbi:hypothetical protein BU23DRAFT_510892, partial [Bimuria novae-zelandiae CBS 107.79]